MRHVVIYVGELLNPKSSQKMDFRDWVITANKLYSIIMIPTAPHLLAVYTKTFQELH